MIQAKCIQKFRDKQNRIYGYRLIDLNGQTQDVTPDNLKNAIANGQIHVINLTLSKDGRLMDTSEKQLQSKELGEKPIHTTDNNLNIAKTIASKLTNTVNSNSAKCELQKGLSDSHNNVIDEYFETNINYKKHKNILLGIFIDSSRLIISINDTNLVSMEEWKLNISGGYRKHLKAIDKFIIDCANRIKESDTQISSLAKAFTLVDWSLVDMGDSYEEMVENLCEMADMNIDVWSLDKEGISKASSEAYQILIDTKYNDLEELFNNLVSDEYYCKRIKNYMYAENVNKLSDSKMYAAVYLIYKYFITKNKKISKLIKENLLDDMKNNGIASIKVGYEAGHKYFEYLDRNIFGTISNDVFTVGHAITSSDIKEHKEYKGYSYVFHKNINRCGAPRIALAALFKNAEAGMVQVDIKIERHGYLSESRSCVGIIGYILDVESFMIKIGTSVEEYSEIIASKFNELAPKLYDLADVHQSLYSMKPHNVPLEIVSLTDLNSHGSIYGSRLVDLAISRWTKIRGTKSPALLDRSVYKSDTCFKKLYINNVSDTGNDRRLYIEYNGSQITVKVLNGGNLDDVVIEETKEMTGSVVHNSAMLSNVIACALISANVKKI